MSSPKKLSLNDAFKQGMAHYQKGQLKPSVTLFSQIIQAVPEHAHAHQMLGLIAFQTKQYEPAVKAMTEAVRLQPQNAQFLANFVEVLRKADLPKEAAAIGKRAVQANPSNPATHSNLGLAYYDLEDLIEAEASQQRALALDPDFGPALNNLGSIARDNGNLDEAIKSYRTGLRANPEYLEMANNLISVLIESERFDEARALAEEQLKKSPTSSDLQRNMGRIHMFDNDLDSAETCIRTAISLDEEKASNYLCLSQLLYEKNHTKLALLEAEKALRMEPESAAAYHQIALCKAQLGDIDAGFEYYNKALEIDPDMATAKIALGHLEMENGDFKAARTYFEEAVKSSAAKPSNDTLSAQIALARLEKVTPENPAFLALEAALPAADTMPVAKAAAYHYALGKSYEDLKRFDEAFEHFAKGAQAKRTSIDYDPDKSDRTTDNIISAFDEKTIKRLRKNAITSDQPIFVVGMPRSGTTLTESILDSHHSVYGAGELSYMHKLFDVRKNSSESNLPHIVAHMSEHDLTRNIENYVESLNTHAPGSPHIVDKMPANFQMIGLIHALMPNAKIVHIARNPMDTCLSCFTRVFERSQLHSYDQVELGRYFNNYVRIMNHWHQLLPEGSFHTVHYEDLIDDIDLEARRIIDHCGLEWDDACLEFYKGKRRVRTASVQQVRQPLYTSSKGKWKKYEAHLKTLLETIGDNRIQFGTCPD